MPSLSSVQPPSRVALSLLRESFGLGSRFSVDSWLSAPPTPTKHLYTGWHRRDGALPFARTFHRENRRIARVVPFDLSRPAIPATFHPKYPPFVLLSTFFLLTFVLRSTLRPSLRGHLDATEIADNSSGVPIDRGRVSRRRTRQPCYFSRPNLPLRCII